MNQQSPSLQRLLAAQQSLPLDARNLQNATQALALKAEVEKIFSLTADIISLLLDVVAHMPVNAPAKP